MKKVFILITLCLLFACITCCKDTASNTKNKATNETEKTETTKITKKENEKSGSSKAQKIKVIYDEDTKLKTVTLTNEEKDKFFNDFLKDRFNYLSENENVKIPYETKITEKIDKYNDVCYSIYRYKKDKLFAFLIREKYDPSRSSFLSYKTVYEGLFLIPVDKVYTIEDFSEIIVNKSDLSDVKKIYKYADILFKQEIELEKSKKKCSINIMSKDSGITINFKKSGDKYIVTKIKNEAKDTFVSMIADVDKNFD